MVLFLTEAAGSGTGSLLIWLLIMVAVFWFFIISPDRKNKKKSEDMRSSLSLGDEITTIGGILGKVVQVTEDTVTFETGEDRVRIQVKKSAIATTAKFEAAQAAEQANRGGLFGRKK